MAAGTYVRARIDDMTKKRAAEALGAMGLTISDAIRLLMVRVANDRVLPFDIKAPNAQSRKALEDLETGKVNTHSSLASLMDDLNSDDSE